MLKLTKKKKLILLSITILTIILLMFIFVFPYQLPRELCISDSLCACKFNKCACSYQCNNIFWRPAEDCVGNCAFSLPTSLNKTCFDNCYSLTGNQDECRDKCFVGHIPKPPKCGCVDSHCEKTYTEYSKYYCTVDEKNYTMEEYDNIFIHGESWNKKIRETIELDPALEQVNLCKCYPKEGKDKFVIIMKKNSQFYSEEFKGRLDEYFEAVKSDVGIENIGVLFFEDDPYALLEKLHSLYLYQDLGYALLIGNDLLEQLQNFEDRGALSFTSHDYNLPFAESDCPSIVVSVLPAPPNSDLNEQKRFISDQIDNYIRFHKNPENYLSKFSRSHMRIVNLDVGDYTSFDPSSPAMHEEIKYRWDLPKRDVLSSDPNLESEIRKEKPMIIDIKAHGWSRIMAWRADRVDFSQLPPHMGTTDEWLNFTKDFTPSVLITGGGCGSMIIDDYNSSVHESDRAKFCCWPQTFLKSGALAYVSDPHARGYDFTDSDFFGQALRKSPLNAKYFGDLFAHI